MKILLMTNCDLRERQVLSCPPLDSSDGQEQIVYAYLYSWCVYESSYRVVSLHSTLKGAFRAKCLAQWQEELEALKQNRRIGRETAKSCGFQLSKSASWRRVDDSVGHMIAAYVIHKD